MSEKLYDILPVEGEPDKFVLVMPSLKAAYKAWEKYDPEFSLDDEGNQILHKEGDDGGKEALFNYYDLEETFLSGFQAALDWMEEMEKLKKKGKKK
jgi:hypothetical protein